MATYTPGDNEDHVVKTESTDSDLDLTTYIQKFKQIKSGLQALPNTKSTPDQETLDWWNNVVVEDSQLQKAILDDQAISLYEQIKPVKDAGLLPSKYDDEYQQLEDYVNSL